VLSDLLMAIHGRHGESPLPVVAAVTPCQCFEAAYEAARLAVHYRTPVILLSDLFLANSSEPWRIPDPDSLPPIEPAMQKARSNGTPFQPYARDAKGARPWAVPGTPGLEHRIGGLEKQDVTGDISYDGANHARMTGVRADRIAGIAAELPPLYVDEDPGAALLVLGWGSSRGAIRAAARRVRANGHRIAIAHLRHLNPLPANTGEVLRRYERVLVPEMNTGQLAQLLRAEFLVDVESYCKLEGKPLFAAELERELMERL
jgi:2-oxoglutarate ferredoxin oxidoreductase subunit alpha